MTCQRCCLRGVGILLGIHRHQYHVGVGKRGMSLKEWLVGQLFLRWHGHVYKTGRSSNYQELIRISINLEYHLKRYRAQSYFLYSVDLRVSSNEAQHVWHEPSQFHPSQPHPWSSEPFDHGHTRGHRGSPKLCSYVLSFRVYLMHFLTHFFLP